MDDFATFLGRFHPVWVHLPIGILLLLGFMEILGLLARARRFAWLPSLTPRQRTLILVVGAVASVLAAYLGWLLSVSGDYAPAQIDRHRSLGLAAAGATLLLLALHRIRWLYAPALGLVLVLLTLAGDAGGRITHGDNYLTAHMPPALARLFGVTIPTMAPKAEPVAVDFSHAAAFANIVQPILQERCASCHGPTKSNGGLRLDSWEYLARGGKHGPVFKPGDLAGSTLVRRIDLPADVKEHMPPKGKPQLADEELTLLEWWVATGAPRDKLLPTLTLPPLVQDILENRLGGGRTEPVPDHAGTLARAGQIAAQLGVLIRPLSPDGPWLEVNARVAGRTFGDRELAQLAPVAAAVQGLDLGNTGVTDAGMTSLQAMSRLERLHLDLTGVTDDGLGRLSGLKKLTYLNLRGTAVTDQGLAGLANLPHLRALYVWQTAVTPAAVEALGESLTDHRKIARWKAEQEAIGREIEEEHFDGNTGESLRPPVTPPAAAATPTTAKNVP